MTGHVHLRPTATRSRLIRTSRRRSLVGAAAVVVCLSSTVALAQVPTNQPTPGINTGAPGGLTGGNTASAPSSHDEQITVRAQRRLLKEKDSPSAVTELGAKQISQVGVGGSVATLLRAAPSVYVYQQGIGNNEPVLSIRGTRGLETAQTYDGVPMQDLLYGGTGSYLNNIVGGHFNLDQISGVSIYPGVAYPDKNTFGTIGGTIAYNSLRPSNDQHVDVFGSVGSFDTFNEGFEADSGRIDSPLGTGPDAIKFMLKYSNLQTNGFIDYTPARYNNMDFAFDKPYGDGQSLFQGTVLYNTGTGLVTPEPIPLPYLAQNGLFSNYSPDQEYQRQTNDYLTIILKNDTYVNDYLNLGLTTFYLNSDSTTYNYANPTLFGPNGEAGSATVGGASPFNQTVAGFGEQDLYGIGGPFYDPQAYPYDGAGTYPPGTANCPASLNAKFVAAGAVSPCGYTAQVTHQHNDTYGLQPRVTFTPPRFLGIDNVIKAGALVAKETQPNGPEYLGAGNDIPETPKNLVAGFDGGTQRTIYQGYLQDKISFLDNTLHITPGVTLEGTDSSFLGSEIYGGTPSKSLLNSAYCAEYGAAQGANQSSCFYGSYKAHKWDREWLPFINIAYDLDKILPAARGVSLYASAGTSALFAPVSDFSPNLLGTPPNASIVHLYEGGIKYNTSNLVLSADYFYQHVERDFGFFSYQSGPMAGDSLYTNDGQREFKGVEAAAIWQVTPQWQLFGNVSHTLAKYLATALGDATVQEDQFGINTRGSAISGVPDWISTFGVEYDHRNTLINGDAFSARFEGQYTGHQSATYDLNGFTNIGPVPGVGSYGSYLYYETTVGATTTDPNHGISPFAIFNLDVNYKLPIRQAGPLKSIAFDLNVLNLFNTRTFQYFYSQISPASCGNFTSGKFKGQGITNYGCTPSFEDGLPNEPFAITFTATARF